MSRPDPDIRDEGLRRLPGRPLPVSFYRRDTLDVARELLGRLFARREADGTWTAVRIVETEAYVGEDDPACHAAAGLTPRTRIMYGRPGRAYVYFTYGMHHLVNFVTGPAGFPAAVLIRAGRPVAGRARMADRRGTGRLVDLASGPSRLCQAMRIDLKLNGTVLDGRVLAVRDDGARPEKVEAGPRVGIRRGTDRRWRFWIAGEPCVSRGRPGPAPARTRKSSSRSEAS